MSVKSKPNSIYLDHNASTPIAEPVRAAMRPFIETAYGNPSSGHWASLPAIEGLEAARTKVASFLGCATNEIVFTSGGTEANNLALLGVWFSRARTGNHIITSAIEHDAIRAPLRFLKRLGAKVTIVPVDRSGRVDPERVAKAITSETCLISIMHANNETGVIQPIQAISSIAKSANIPFHTDAAQSAGKISTRVDDLGVDMLSLAGHKMYGPKGVGALYLRDGLQISPHNHGAGHENGQRAGTESALLTTGLGTACDYAAANNYDHVRDLRDALWQQLSEQLGDRVALNGHPEHRVPNTLNVSFPNQVGADILAKLDGVAAATGSACHAGCVDMSPVLIAMRTPVHVGMGAIRLSLGHQNTRAEIDNVADRLVEIVSR